MSRFRLAIPEPLLSELVAHLRACLPAEGCGLLAGTIVEDIGRVTHHLPLVNALASPTEFESEPRSLFAAHKAMRGAGVEVLAVYHSHPTSEPIPSRRDIERNYAESVVNLIVGFTGELPSIRAWWIAGDVAKEADWDIPHDSRIHGMQLEVREFLSSHPSDRPSQP